MDSKRPGRKPGPAGPPRSYLTLEEVAELLGVPEREVYRRVRRGDWPGSLRLQTEPRWLVPRDALEA